MIEYGGVKYHAFPEYATCNGCAFSRVVVSCGVVHGESKFDLPTQLPCREHGIIYAKSEDNYITAKTRFRLLGEESDNEA